MIGILNYSAGNIKSVENALTKLKIDALLVSEVKQLKDINGLIIPGVGAFDFAKKALDDMGFTKEVFNDFSQKKALLGICLGMQLLFEQGTEGKGGEGLGFFKGDVMPFESKCPVPHMGWNRVSIIKESPLTKGLGLKFDAYFAHSFKVSSTDSAIGNTDYGEKFVSIAAKGNVYGVQFHPEKSGESGHKLLMNFKERCDEIISGNRFKNGTSSSSL